MVPAEKSAAAKETLHSGEGLTLLRRWEPTASVLISLYATSDPLIYELWNKWPGTFSASGGRLRVSASSAGEAIQNTEGYAETIELFARKVDYGTLVMIADYCVWRVDGAGLADWVAIRADIGRMLRKRRTKK